MGLIHLHDTAPVPTLPETLAGYQELIDRMLAKNPAERFNSMDEILAHNLVATGECIVIVPAAET